MKVTTEILVIPPGVAITGVFGKDLMAISRSTGASWEYDPEDKTIKLKGSPKSVQQSVNAINKQLSLHLAKVEQSNPSNGRPKTLLRTKTLSSSTTSVGLKGVSAEIAKERASASLARSRSVRNSTDNTLPSHEQTSQPFFVLRAPKLASGDLWNFVPFNQASTRDTPYVVLQQANPSFEISSTTAPTDITRRQLALFHLEDKSVVALKTFMMLAASSTFEKDKVALRVVLGNQLFIKPKNHALPTAENPVSFINLQGIPEQYIRSHFNEQINKTVAARLEKHITEDLGFAYCGERSEIRARVVDQSDGTLYTVVFAMDLRGGTALVPIKVSKIQHVAHHVTYIREGPVDFRVMLSARDIIHEPVAANNRTPSTPRFSGSGKELRMVRRFSSQDSLPNPKTCADLFAFLKKVTWCGISDTAKPPSSSATGSNSVPFRVSAVPSSAKIKLVYPTEDIKFSIESYRRLRKRRFEGTPSVSTPSAFAAGSDENSFDPYPSPPRDGDHASLPTNKNLVRIKISRVDQSNEVRYFKATGSFVSLNEAIRNGRPDYFKLESCIQFFKDVAEGCRNLGTERKAGSWI